MAKTMASLRDGDRVVESGECGTVYVFVRIRQDVDPGDEIHFIPDHSYPCLEV
jgi:hypothetical protein